MSPLRNAPTVPWEAAFSFEHAVNTVRDISNEEELFIPEYSGGELSQNVNELLSLVHLAETEIISAWSRGGRLARADEIKLEAIARSCHATLGFGGAVLVRTEHLDDLADCKSDDKLRKLGVEGLLWAMKDGLSEWILRGRGLDVRACLWHGGLFRADRETALFCQPKCRTGYHRALTTAQSSDRSPEALMGFFKCGECERDLLINAASGLVKRWEGLFIGGVSDRDSICVSCAEKNHPEWGKYFKPTAAAA